MKKPDIIVHLGINDVPYKNEDNINKELKGIKDLINRKRLGCKNIFISTAHIRKNKLRS